MKEQERRKKGAQELKGIFKTSVKIFFNIYKNFFRVSCAIKVYFFNF